jgi:hypothetical protein
MPEIEPLQHFAKRPTFFPPAWPIRVNVFLLILLFGNYLQKAGPDAWYMLEFIILAIAVNLVGAVIALLRRKWTLAAWYVLALFVILGTQWAMLYISPIPLGRRIET